MPDDNSVFEDDKEEEEKYFNYAKKGHLSKDDSKARACYALAFWSLLNKVAPKKADEWSNQIEQLHEEPLTYDEPLIDQLDKEKDKSESRNTEENSSPQFFNAESAREALINNAPLRVQEEITRCTEEIKAKAELGLDRMTWKTSHHLYRLDRVLAHELRKLGYEVEFKSQHRIEITWYIDYNQFLRE